MRSHFLSLATLLATATTASAVAYTATINGFADAGYNYIPECAKTCVAKDTSSTQCPYWEMGCLCVWTPWSSAVGECVAEACKGADVASFTSAATSACSSYGVQSPYWKIGSTASSKLAADETKPNSVSSNSYVYTTRSAPVITSSYPAPITGSSSKAKQSSDFFHSNHTKSIVNDVSVYVNGSTTITSTVCTKCKTLSGSGTTTMYITVTKGKTSTITAACSSSTTSSKFQSSQPATKSFVSLASSSSATKSGSSSSAAKPAPSLSVNKENTMSFTTKPTTSSPAIRSTTISSAVRSDSAKYTGAMSSSFTRSNSTSTAVKPLTPSSINGASSSPAVKSAGLSSIVNSANSSTAKSTVTVTGGGNSPVSHSFMTLVVLLVGIVIN
ncbi:hypothetical protein JCM33374_g3144 [Metschnikowia sp. JCM 33374]|nr:hypothetical protein JCM33374_g3144 [Metschnikowia sp. JCM 33374]